MRITRKEQIMLTIAVICLAAVVLILVCARIRGPVGRTPFPVERDVHPDVMRAEENFRAATPLREALAE